MQNIGITLLFIVLTIGLFWFMRNLYQRYPFAFFIQF